MTKPAPDHRDAELLLKVYDLRREAVMREARIAMIGKFWPAAYDDYLAVTKPDHPLNAPYRQTATYWEMVFGMASHGIVSPEYWVEFNGEGLLLFAKIHPFLARIRQDVAPTAFRHAEWAATQTEVGKLLFARFQARVAATMKKE